MGTLYFFEEEAITFGKEKEFVHVADDHGVPVISIGYSFVDPEKEFKGARFEDFEQFERFVDAVIDLRNRLKPDKSDR